MPDNSGVRWFNDGTEATNWAYGKRGEYKQQGFNVGYSNITGTRNNPVANQYITKVDALEDGRWVVRYGPSTENMTYDPGGKIVERPVGGKYASFGSAPTPSYNAQYYQSLMERLAKLSLYFRSMRNRYGKQAEL